MPRKTTTTPATIDTAHGSCPSCGAAMWQDSPSDAPYCLDCPTPEARYQAALALVASLGPDAQAALDAYLLAHETPDGLLFAQVDAQEKQQLAAAQAAAAGEDGQSHALPIRPGIIQAPAAAPVLTAGSLATMANAVPGSGTNEAYQDKLVVAYNKGSLGQIVVAHLQRYGVAAVAIAGAMPSHLAPRLYILNQEELAQLEADLPADLAQRLLELRQLPKATAAKPGPAAGTIGASKNMKYEAKQSRKAAGKASIRRMLTQAAQKVAPYPAGQRPRPDATQATADAMAEAGLMLPYPEPQAKLAPGCSNDMPALKRTTCQPQLF